MQIITLKIPSFSVDHSRWRHLKSSAALTNAPVSNINNAHAYIHIHQKYISSYNFDGNNLTKIILVRRRRGGGGGGWGIRYWYNKFIALGIFTRKPYTKIQVIKITPVYINRLLQLKIYITIYISGLQSTTLNNQCYLA